MDNHIRSAFCRRSVVVVAFGRLWGGEFVLSSVMVSEVVVSMMGLITEDRNTGTLVVNIKIIYIVGLAEDTDNAQRRTSPH